MVQTLRRWRAPKAPDTAPCAPAQLDDKEWIDGVVKGEDIVQREDMHMCDLVQSGLTSPAYDVGRCASSPAPTLCMRHHCIMLGGAPAPALAGWAFVR